MTAASATTPALERRRERRVPVHLPMLVRGTDRTGDSFEEHTSSENLCRGGAAFATRYPLEPRQPTGNQHSRRANRGQRRHGVFHARPHRPRRAREGTSANSSWASNSQARAFTACSFRKRLSSAGFSLWGLDLARTKLHRLEACATRNSPFQQKLLIGLALASPRSRAACLSAALRSSPDSASSCSTRCLSDTAGSACCCSAPSPARSAA